MVTLRAAGHRPRVGNWPITVVASKGGQPVRGHISYEFLLNGQVVGTQPVTGVSPNFRGTFHDVIMWPARAVGVALTLRVVVSTDYGVRDIDYAVRVSR